MNNLLKQTKITVVSGAVAAGQTEVLSSIIDMQGWDGVMFIATTGDVTDTCVLTLTVKGNSANSTSSPTPVVQGSATFTADATSGDSKALAVEVSNPLLRYKFASLTRTAANAVVNSIIAIQYRGHLQPSTHDASMIANTYGQGVAS
jgi:hypothetical protein